MRLLLPPSEAKNPGGRGRPLADRPPHPTLGAAREGLLTAVERLVAGPEAAAARALLLPPAAVAGALAANARARSGPTLPALRRYAGVVYDGLASCGLDAAEERLAGRSVLVFSGLLGVVRGDEAVPLYRVPAKAVLPGIGIAGTFWRSVLDTALPPMLGRSGVIVDLRSSDYTAMWRPDARTASRVITVRMLSPLPSGGRGVVSYPSKFAKGVLAGALVRRVGRGEPVTGAADVAAAWLESGGAHAETDGATRVIVHTA